MCRSDQPGSCPHSFQEEVGWNFFVSLDEELDLAIEVGADEDLGEEADDEVSTPAQER